MSGDKKYNVIIISGIIFIILVIGFILYIVLSKKKIPFVKKDIKSILFVGDSNTKANFSYADKIKTDFPKISVKKIAENGQNTGWMLSQLNNELASNKYDVVSVLGGSNDIYGGMPVAQTESNMANMNNLIKSKGAISVFITPPNKDFYTGKTEANQRKLSDLVDWMKRQNFDVFINFKDMTNNKNLFSENDGYLHPQSVAHSILEREFANKLKLA